MDTKSPFRFSLRTLLLAVVAVSVGTAAMVSASEWWQTSIMTATFALIVLAILLAAFRNGSSRAFWIGFAVCSSAYMLSMIVQIDNLRVADQLLPGKLLHLAVAKLHAMPNGAYAPGSVSPSYSVPTATAYPYPAPPTPVPATSVTPALLTPTPADDPIPPAEPTKPVDSSGCGPDEEPSAQIVPILEDGSVAPQPVPTILPPVSGYSWNTASSVPATYYATPYGIPVTDDVFSRQYRSLTIGHCLWAIVFGVIGGWFAVWLHAMREGCKKIASENAAATKASA